MYLCVPTGGPDGDPCLHGQFAVDAVPLAASLPTLPLMPTAAVAAFAVRMNLLAAACPSAAAAASIAAAAYPSPSAAVAAEDSAQLLSM